MANKELDLLEYPYYDQGKTLPSTDILKMASIVLRDLSIPEQNRVLNFSYMFSTIMYGLLMGENTTKEMCIERTLDADDIFSEILLNGKTLYNLDIFLNRTVSAKDVIPLDFRNDLPIHFDILHSTHGEYSVKFNKLLVHLQKMYLDSRDDLIPASKAIMMTSVILNMDIQSICDLQKDFPEERYVDLFGWLLNYQFNAVLGASIHTLNRHHELRAIFDYEVHDPNNSTKLQ